VGGEALAADLNVKIRLRKQQDGKGERWALCRRKVPPARMVLGHTNGTSGKRDLAVPVNRSVRQLEMDTAGLVVPKVR